MRPRLLLVEDDEPQARVIARGLDRAGFDVRIAGDGRRALDAWGELDFNIVVLDLMLPDIDGIEICREIRQTSQIPLLIVSGKGETLDIVVALEVGADDYVTKPVAIPELVARVRALLRRFGSRVDNRRNITVDGLQIDTEAFTVHQHGAPVAMSPTEFRLLVELAREAGRAVTREELLRRVWGYDYLGPSRIVDMAVKRLRERVEKDPRNPVLVETIRGVGYRLSAPNGEMQNGDLYTLSSRLRAECETVARDLNKWTDTEDPLVETLTSSLNRVKRLLDLFERTVQAHQPDIVYGPPGTDHALAETVTRPLPMRYRLARGTSLPALEGFL